MRTTRHAWLFGAALAACTNDPEYLPSPMILEAGMDDGMGGITEARSSLTLPIDLETPEDAMVRAARAAALGVEVPYVKVGDIEVSVEWTIKNLDATEGLATIQLNGATEYFVYDPTLIVLGDPEEDPPAPPLAGGIPLHIAGNQTISGVFREDQLREASIDADQITRANVNPFAATLTINKNTAQIQPYLPYDPMMPDVVPGPDPNATPIPREAFAQLIRVDLVFTPDRPMVLEYTVRIRDLRGIVNERLLEAPPGELTVFMPAEYSIGVMP
jgi:hypothetical protein